MDFETLWFIMLVVVLFAWAALALDLFITLICRWYGLEDYEE
jgi:hypothetical protein